MAKAAKGVVIAAPTSGSGKTLVTLGICRALKNRGLSVAPAKTGPDYIDPAFLSRAATHPAINLDAWAMPAAIIKGLAAQHTMGHDTLVLEGVMGLFDGAAPGGGSTADLATILNLPIVLVADCSHMAQSVAALIEGFVHHRTDVQIQGIILNKVGSMRHEKMLRTALESIDVKILGALHRDKHVRVPERHLGLVLPGEVDNVEQMITHAANIVEAQIDIDGLLALASPVAPSPMPNILPPLGQHIAIAHDAAFTFIYQHFLHHWQAAGATLSFFSPLLNQAPDPAADAIFLPGGYPELHGEALSKATNFTTGLHAAKQRGALIYGECGGFMVLGKTMTDKSGTTHEMTGLLSVETRMDEPKRVLGYRQLSHTSPLPWPQQLRGHEFHYSSAELCGLPGFYAATDAAGADLGMMGAVDGRVMGSYAHVIGAGL